MNQGKKGREVYPRAQSQAFPDQRFRTLIEDQEQPRKPQGLPPEAQEADS